MVLLQQMIIFFLILLVGFYCSKAGLWQESGVNQVSAVIANVTGPALVLSAGINPDSRITGGHLLLALLWACAAHAILMGFGMLFAKLFRVPQDEAAVYKAMSTISNVGFLGVPVVHAVYGEEAMLYLTIFLFPNSFLLYSYIIYLMKGKRASGTFSLYAVLKKTINAGNVACLLAIMLCLLRWQVPAVIASTVESIGGLTGALSMMVVGNSMTKMNPRAFVRDRRLLLYSVLRMLALPLAVMSLLRHTSLPLPLLEASMIFFALPVGVMNAIMALQYGGNHLLASKGVALTTMMALATMPIVALVLGF